MGEFTDMTVVITLRKTVPDNSTELEMLIICFCHLFSVPFFEWRLQSFGYGKADTQLRQSVFLMKYLRLYQRAFRPLHDQYQL